MHPSSRVSSNSLVALLAGLALCATGCGGGGGGGGGAGGGGNAALQLQGVSYGRLLDEGTTRKIVSPLTTVSTDPVTGLTIPGSLKALSPDVNVNALVSLNIGADYVPRVVPRNGVFVLQFSSTLDPATVVADQVDANGDLVIEGSIQFRTQSGTAAPMELTVVGGTQVWANPQVNDEVGLPPSPIDFGPDGEPRADATGFLRITLPRTGSAVLRNQAGALLIPRNDGLGDVDNSIGINPGNEVLDFIAQDELIPTNETFNGFLPDLTAPRVIRDHSFTATLDFSAGDSAGASTITDVSARFESRASDGAGEWANRRLVLRPGQADEESHVVASNGRTNLVIKGVFDSLPRDGDPYRLTRAEFFEPDLADPIDPELFDPYNPENDANTQFTNFVDAYEIDTLGNRVGSRLDVADPLPAFSSLTVRFNEPMALRSLRQWESFMVTRNPDPGETHELVTNIRVNKRQDTVTIEPARPAEAPEYIGWGLGVTANQFTLVSIPEVSFLQSELSGTEVQAFLDEGRRGVTDLGGRTLGFPKSLFNEASPAIVFSIPFVADESISSAVVPPAAQDFGVIVHRFRGKPQTGTDPDRLIPGVKYKDQYNYYTPIADVNLQVNGFLAGQPVVFVTKVHDNFFPPTDGQLNPFPFGAGTPLSSYYPSGTPANQPHQGARFQHVFRDVDASPGLELRGTLLDLYRVSWAPIGGNVTTDTYEDISVHAAHSHYRPMTSHDGGSACSPYHGIYRTFDYATWISNLDGQSGLKCSKFNCDVNDGPNYFDGTFQTCVPAGTSYRVTQSKLFSPPFDSNAYHPWPEFDRFGSVYQYNNGGRDHDVQIRYINQELGLKCNTKANPWKDRRGKDSNLCGNRNDGGDSLLLEYRIRPQEQTISRLNGMMYAIGVLIDSQPRWRAFSVGETDEAGIALPLNPDDISNATDERARCASGPVFVNGGGTRDFGDNSRYFTVFDYVKTTSRITSPYVLPESISFNYYDAFVIPSLNDQPAGSQVSLLFEGAAGVKGNSGTGFDEDVDRADGKAALAFRAIFVGNTSTRLLPNFDTIAIPFRKD